MATAKPVLLEPLMSTEVAVPAEFQGTAVALVSHGSLLAEQLGYVPRLGAVHVQTVRFGEDPLVGLSLGQEHTAVEARPGWLCLHSCEF